ncbi:hypothetical protein, partial [Kangiella sp.]|uniref:hypothetical protein n=1 Tax=Kangiella sp. TaxID=1920245 RepID=UPI0025BCF670
LSRNTARRHLKNVSRLVVGERIVNPFSIFQTRTGHPLRVFLWLININIDSCLFCDRKAIGR